MLYKLRPSVSGNDSDVFIILEQFEGSGALLEPEMKYQIKAAETPTKGAPAFFF